MNEPEILLTDKVFDVVRKDRATRDGSIRSRAIVRHPGSVAILPVLEDGRIVLIRNYRVSIEETLVEIPAGTLERGEEPRSAAHRELAEETGYRAETMELLNVFHPSPGISTERMWLYRAEGLRPGPTAHEKGEEIEIFLASQESAWDMVREGRIHDAKTMISLLLLREQRRG